MGGGTPGAELGEERRDGQGGPSGGRLDDADRGVRRPGTRSDPRAWRPPNAGKILDDSTSGSAFRLLGGGVHTPRREAVGVGRPGRTLRGPVTRGCVQRVPRRGHVPHGAWWSRCGCCGAPCPSPSPPGGAPGGAPPPSHLGLVPVPYSPQEQITHLKEPRSLCCVFYLIFQRTRSFIIQNRESKLRRNGFLSIRLSVALSNCL